MEKQDGFIPGAAPESETEDVLSRSSGDPPITTGRDLERAEKRDDGGAPERGAGSASESRPPR